MMVTRENEMRFVTPLGRAFVWGLVNSLTHGIGGWHFVLMGANGLENYYSEHGMVFSRASVHSPNLLIHSEETNPEKTRVLRKLWETYIERLHLDSVHAGYYPQAVSIS